MLQNVRYHARNREVCTNYNAQIRSSFALSYSGIYRRHQFEKSFFVSSPPPPLRTIDRRRHFLTSGEIVAKYGRVYFRKPGEVKEFRRRSGNATNCTT